MIEINLLPASWRKKQLPQFKFPQGNLKKFLAILIAVWMLVHFLLQVFIIINAVRLRQQEKAFAGILPQKQQVDEIKAHVDKAKAFEDLFSRVSVRRFVAAAKLDYLSDVLPEGVWFQELSFSQEMGEIKGSCISLNAQELTQVGKFLNALRADKQMRKDFPRIELVSVQRRKLGATEIVDFVISLRSQVKAQSGQK